MDTFDLIVIGGGISGAWVALRALEAGLSTLLLTRDTLERTTTWMSGGILSPHAELLPESYRERGARGIAAYEELLGSRNDLPPRTFGFGVIVPVFEGDPVEPLLKYLEKLPEGVWQELSPREVLAPSPGVVPISAIYFPRDAYVDPRIVLKILKDQYQSRGGIWKQEEALEIHYGERLRVLTPTSTYASTLLVLAVGANPLPWKGSVPEAKGDRGVMVHIAHSSPPPFVLFHHGVRATTYIVPDPQGVRLGSTSNPLDTRMEVDPVELGDLLMRGAKLWGPLKQGSFQEAGVGFRPFFPEAPEPFARALPGFERLFLLNGFHRNGILLAPSYAEEFVHSWISRS